MSEPTEPSESTEPTELVEPAEAVDPTAPAPSGDGVAAAADSASPTAATEAALPDDAPAPASSRSKVGWIVGGVVAVVVLLVVVIALVARPAPGYSDATRQRFVAACTADGGAGVQGPCGCVYDKLSSTMPYDRFADVDAQLKAQFPSTPQGQPLTLPPDVQAAVEACRTTR